MTALSYNFKGKMGYFDYRYFHICMGEFFIFILETSKFLFFFYFLLLDQDINWFFFFFRVSYPWPFPGVLRMCDIIFFPLRVWYNYLWIHFTIKFISFSFFLIKKFCFMYQTIYLMSSHLNYNSKNKAHTRVFRFTLIFNIDD